MTPVALSCFAAPASFLAAGSEGGVSGIWLALGLLEFLLILAAVWWYFVVEPARRRRPLLAAYEMLQGAEADERLEEAALLLGDALTAGLRKSDVTDARFALAYVRARMGRLEEGAATLSDIGDGRRDRETDYLDLWIRCRLKQWDRVEEIHERRGKDLGNLLDAKLMLAIAILERARVQWAAKQVGPAAEQFRRLRAMKLLLEEIPEDIDDQQVVLGVSALFEKETETAQKRFQGALESAKSEGRSTVLGELGLLLCAWRTQGGAEVDAALGALLDRMEKEHPPEAKRLLATCPACQREFLVSPGLRGHRATCGGCRRGFTVPKDVSEPPAPADGEAPPAPRPRLLGDAELLLRNAILWHAVTTVARWSALPRRGGLPVAARKTLDARLARVRKVDAEMAEAFLLEGLLAYYFAPDQDARDRAVETISKAIQAGVAVPEVLNLVERERHIAESWRDSLAHFYLHMEQYLGNAAVPAELRQALLERLQKFRRFREIEVADVPDSEAAAPSLTDLKGRTLLLRERIRRLHRQLAADPSGTAAQSVEGLVGDLEERTRELTAAAQGVETTENALMGVAGEFLLKDEEPTEPTPP